MAVFIHDSTAHRAPAPASPHSRRPRLRAATARQSRSHPLHPLRDHAERGRGAPAPGSLHEPGEPSRSRLQPHRVERLRRRRPRSSGNRRRAHHGQADSIIGRGSGDRAGDRLAAGGRALRARLCHRGRAGRPRRRARRGGGADHRRRGPGERRLATRGDPHRHGASRVQHGVLRHHDRALPLHPQPRSAGDLAARGVGAAPGGGVRVPRSAARSARGGDPDGRQASDDGPAGRLQGRFQDSAAGAR